MTATTHNKSDRAALAESLRAGCWIWPGFKNTFGYGEIRIGGSRRVAHRVLFEIARGPVPVGLVLDHLCYNPACVNPDHLEPVTRGENVDRGREINKRGRFGTHCKWGHEWTDETTIYNNRGVRVCRPCAYRRGVEYRARKASS